MSDSSLRMEVIGEVRVGSPLTVRLHLEGAHTDLSSLRVEATWGAFGMQTGTDHIVCAVRHTLPCAADQRTWTAQIPMPWAPPSYMGEHVRIIWSITAQAMRTTGQPLIAATQQQVLPGTAPADAQAIAKKRYQRWRSSRRLKVLQDNLVLLLGGLLFGSFGLLGLLALPGALRQGNLVLAIFALVLAAVFLVVPLVTLPNWSRLRGWGMRIAPTPRWLHLGQPVQIKAAPGARWTVGYTETATERRHVVVRGGDQVQEHHHGHAITLAQGKVPEDGRLQFAIPADAPVTVMAPFRKIEWSLTLTRGGQERIFRFVVLPWSDQTTSV